VPAGVGTGGHVSRARSRVRYVAGDTPPPRNAGDLLGCPQPVRNMDAWPSLGGGDIRREAVPAWPFCSGCVRMSAAPRRVVPLGLAAPCASSALPIRTWPGGRPLRAILSGTAVGRPAFGSGYGGWQEVARRGGQRPRGMGCQSGAESYTSLCVSRTTWVPSARMTKISGVSLSP
jgi:hypothetical protein